MDSEDEFMSDPPSGDDLDFDEGTQDSELGSIGGGMFWPRGTIVVTRLLTRLLRL